MTRDITPHADSQWPPIARLAQLDDRNGMNTDSKAAT